MEEKHPGMIRSGAIKDLTPAPLGLISIHIESGVPSRVTRKNEGIVGYVSGDKQVVIAVGDLERCMSRCVTRRCGRSNARNDLRGPFEWANPLLLSFKTTF